MVANGIGGIMKLSLTALVVVFTGMVLLGGALACNPPTADPTPTPVPIERVEDIYKFYQDEKANNETRLKGRIDRKEIRALHGVVSRIDGTKVQFLHTDNPLEKDTYVECKFQNEQQVWTLNKGEAASVIGMLAGVNGTVKFDNCRLVPRR